VLVVPKGTKLGKSTNKIFKPIPANTDDNPSERNHEAYVCHRFAHCPVLYIRSARVEDHDDLMPIFNKHNTELTAKYGDFFLSELIEAEDEDYKSIVADVDGTAIGFMNISTDVDLDVLEKCFELEPFNGLKQYRRKEITKKEVPDEKHGARRGTPKSRPTTEISITVNTDDPSTPSSLVVGSPTHMSASHETLRSASSVTSSSDRKGKSPLSKGLHRTRQKSAKAAEKAASVKMEKTSALSHDQDIKRPVSEMTLPSMEREGQQEKQETKDDDTAARSSKGEYARSDKEANVTFETELVHSALCIQLFCIDEKYEMRSLDFLPKVFELFPEKEFCIMTIPHTVPEFSLLQSFKRATPKPESTLSQDLYVFRRSGLLSSIVVRKCQADDRKGIEVLTKIIKGREFLISDVQKFLDTRRDEDGTEIRCYIAECLGQIIGVAVLRQEQDIEFIRAHYNIEDFIYFNHHQREEHGHLNHFVINPAFSHYTRHFLKEMLRLSKKSCLYYPLFRSLEDAQVEKPHSLVTCLNELVPIRVRRQIVYPLDKLGINAPSERILRKQEGGYSLYHMNRKLTLEPKVVINVRIVVVGASDVAISCLDTLVNCPHLCFNNLTLVSSNGLEEHSAASMSTLLSKSFCFSKAEYEAMVLPTWVNVIDGKMIKIDRVNKKVILSNEKEVPYDHLLLCTGQQFQLPVPTGADIASLVTTSEAKQKKQPKVFKGHLPQNVFRVNDTADTKAAFEWVESNIVKTEGKVLIYGATLEAYNFIHGLLQAGVSGEQIIFVQPPFNEVSCFNNKKVEQLVYRALEEKGVDVYEDCTLARWNDGAEKAQLKCATFTTNAKPVRVDCQAFFCFQEKQVDYDAFKAINDSCLVYDGRLVIDTGFRTNDPFIKAAGSLTKYARRYHVNSWNHAVYNSKEVGIKLAGSLLNLFDPTLEEDSNEETLNEKLIPTYYKPKIQAAILPGGFHYLHVSKPSLPIPLESLVVRPDYGMVLETQGSDGDKYFRLHLNQYRSIETITCLSTKGIEIENLICLYGIHERYLNNLVQRYDEGLIKDFYSFFQESWCLAIFHDRFIDLRTEIHEIFAEKESHDGKNISFEEMIHNLIDEDMVLSEFQRDTLGQIYNKSRSKRLIDQRLLSFLNYNNYHLPMYAKPGLV